MCFFVLFLGPVCVPIKDREEKNKLDSSLAKTKQVASSTSNKQELINNQHHSKSLTRNVEISDNTKSDKQRQSDHQTASKQQTINRDQSKSSFSVKSAIVSSKATYSNNSADHSTNSNRKEVYDFDDELDEQPNKFGKLSNKQVGYIWTFLISKNFVIVVSIHSNSHF